jgi:hypothetical protein
VILGGGTLLFWVVKVWIDDSGDDKKIENASVLLYKDSSRLVSQSKELRERMGSDRLDTSYGPRWTTRNSLVYYTSYMNRVSHLTIQYQVHTDTRSGQVTADAIKSSDGRYILDMIRVKLDDGTTVDVVPHKRGIFGFLR